MISVELDRATTLPAAWYGADPTIWERERTAIFGREWLMVGREAELPEPGSYLTEIVAGWPIFIIRGPGGIAARLPQCLPSPRRTDPMGGKGSMRYPPMPLPRLGLRHARQSAPHARVRGCSRFRQEDFGLFPIQVGLWRGLIFVNLDEKAPPLEQAMAAITAETAPFAIEGYTFHSSAEHEMACNWKTYVDNYAEGYHVPDIHPGLNREIDSKQYRVMVKERHAVHQAPQRDGANYSGLWLWRFPNLAMNIYPTGMNIERMVPLGPNRTKLVYNFFFQDVSPAAELTIQGAIEAGHQVAREDIRICEAVQRNLDAGLYDTGRLSPRHENGVWYFQKLVREALAA